MRRVSVCQNWHLLYAQAIFVLFFCKRKVIMSKMERDGGWGLQTLEVNWPHGIPRLFSCLVCPNIPSPPFAGIKTQTQIVWGPERIRSHQGRWRSGVEGKRNFLLFFLWLEHLSHSPLIKTSFKKFKSHQILNDLFKESVWGCNMAPIPTWRPGTSEEKVARDLFVVLVLSIPSNRSS